MEIKEEKILAYLNHELSQNERDKLEKEISNSQTLEKQLSDYRFIYEQSQLLNKQSRYNTQDNWSLLEKKLCRDQWIHRAWLVIRNTAAILTIPLLITLISIWIHEDKISHIADTIEVTSVHGTISKIILPDSSIVWLNSGSKLLYPEEFEKGKRNVRLIGEAYFIVNADKDRPFNVMISDLITVSAYGTEFNISAFKDDSLIKATLSKGNIDILLVNRPAITLKVGEQFSINKNNNVYRIKECDLNEVSAWREGKLVFRRADLNEVITKLSRYFNVEFILSNNLIEDFEFSGTFANESLPEILSILEQTNPIHFEIVESKIHDDYTYIPRKVILEKKVLP